MNLTRNKLKYLFEKNYKKINDIAKRFEEICIIIDKIKSDECKVEIENDGVKINGKKLQRKDLKSFSLTYFGPAKDGLTKPEAYSGVEAISKVFPDEYRDIIIKIGNILGGFDFKTHTMKDKYRILSNSITSEDDYHGSLTSQGQSRHPSSHFADNNYFFNIMYFIQTLDFEKTIMVLRYPGNYFSVKDDDENFSKEYQKQKEVLQYRFPPKFLWMWAKKDEVIHPISLMAFRNFLNSEYGKSILKDVDKNYTPESVTNMKFDKFKEAWEKINNKILEDLEIDKNEENIQKLSLLISQICIEETDIKNISDLLQTGNQAVILWGPPGTGKTHESMEVVKELLSINQEKLKEEIKSKSQKVLTDKEIEQEVEQKIEQDYLFSKNENNLSKNDKGYYEIIQFHPNYTYQDFIGGIAPKINKQKKSYRLQHNNESSISYELREGIFKRFCDKAKQNINKEFIFIIDEINRAELSAVFGELLFALEYRGKLINLPYFGEFTIPENVYIIGTMNNVDKSLVTFDLALRRRFGFFKLMPKLEVINEVLSGVVEKESLEKYYKKCKNLNEKIKTELDLGEDYQIGQAYFLKIKDFLEQDKNEQVITSFELEKLWVYNIEPLLEEYLGMALEDETIQEKLKKLKIEFIEK